MVLILYSSSSKVKLNIFSDAVSISLYFFDRLMDKCVTDNSGRAQNGNYSSGKLSYMDEGL
jgi:hypothetical protein